VRMGGALKRGDGGKHRLCGALGDWRAEENKFRAVSQSGYRSRHQQRCLYELALWACLVTLLFGGVLLWTKNIVR